MMKNMTYITYCIVLIFSSKIIPFHLVLLLKNAFFFFHMGKKRRDTGFQFEEIIIAFLQTQGVLSLFFSFLFSTKMINSNQY